MRIEVHQGHAAAERLQAITYLAQWRALAEACPWATAFQSPEFVCVWYRVYAPRFEPVVVSGWGADGTLVGLLTLAKEREGPRFVAAGWYQAEYQTWIADPAHAAPFVAGAIEAIQREVPRRALTFKYVPPEAPLEFLHAAGLRSPRVVVDRVSRGLLDVRTGEHEASLRKKSNKSKMKRLERLGAVTLDRITSPEAMDALLSRLEPFCDLRQGALHDAMPFRDDPLHRELYRALLEVPGFLDVSTLRCAGDVASAHINVRNGRTVMLGVVGHSPFLAEHSPGKLHTLLLARQLASEGCDAFDLTPGGDAYKDRVATQYDEVRVVRLFPSRAARLRFLAFRRARDLARRLVRRAGLESAVRALASAVREAVKAHPDGGAFRALGRGMLRWVHSDTTVRMYAVDSPFSFIRSSTSAVRRDSIEDLLLYRPGGERRQSRHAFLRAALRRLESGQHCYTATDSGALRAVAWVVEGSAEMPSDELWSEVSLEPGSMLVHDVRYWPSATNAGLSRVEIMDRLLGAVVRAEPRTVLIAVEDGSGAISDVARQVGAPFAAWQIQTRWRRLRTRVSGTPLGDRPHALTRTPGTASPMHGERPLFTVPREMVSAASITPTTAATP